MSRDQKLARTLLKYEMETCTHTDTQTVRHTHIEKERHGERERKILGRAICALSMRYDYILMNVMKHINQIVKTPQAVGQRHRTNRKREWRKVSCPMAPTNKQESNKKTE